jgi:hypothetical protein
MPAENCNVTECQFNKIHPSGNGRTCNIDVLSIDKGKCEYWDSYQVSVQLNLLKVYEEAQKVLKDKNNV